MLLGANIPNLGTMFKIYFSILLQLAPRNNPHFVSIKRESEVLT